MSITGGIIAGVGAASSIGSAAIGANAAGNAASVQAAAANHAADLQYQSGQNALAFQKQEYNQQQQNIAPWLQAGQSAIGQLSSLMQPGGGLSQQWNQHFQAPTDVTEQNDPGYKFRLSQGLDALNNSAAAKGGLLSGGTAKAINNYAQQDASNEYSNVYNRQLGEYQQNYNQFQQSQANQYNRLAGISGTGQTGAGQLASAGGQAAGNISNIYGNIGAQVGNSYQNAGAATASGYVGGANAYSAGIGGVGYQTGQLAQLLGNSSSYSYPNNGGIGGSGNQWTNPDQTGGLYG